MKNQKILLVLLLLCVNWGCTKSDDLEVFGGEIVKNNVMYVSSSPLAYELPVISNKKIEDFEIEEFIVNGEGEYQIEYEEITGGNQYKNYYYYFVHILVDVSSETAADFSIDSVDMIVNGSHVNYEMKDMKFTNTKSKFSNYKTEENDLVYSSDITFMYQTIPNETTQNISIETQSDCMINDFGVLDYLNIDNLDISVNGKKKDLKEGIQVVKGDEVSVSFTLSYKDNANEESLLKTTRYFSYLNKDGEKCLFIEPQGFIIVNYIDDTFIKQYIDKKTEEN